jgi:hypothetical protein
MRALAVAMHGEAAGIVRGVDLPRKAGTAVALVILAHGQLAVEHGVAIRCLQIELVQFDALAGPAAGEVELVRGEHGLLGLGDCYGTDMHAIQQQIQRRLQ